jgi:AcrR family transcriptional regulator
MLLLIADQMRRIISLKRVNTNSKRPQILEAACSIVRTKGAAQITLDAVAIEAGISKGGLMYHFPTKDSLLRAMADAALELFSNRIEEEEAASTEEKGNFITAYIRASFDPGNNGIELANGWMAAMANDPDILHNAREHFDKIQYRAENDGIDPVLATILRLASDGLWFSDLFNFAPIKDEMRQKIESAILKITKEGTI